MLDDSQSHLIDQSKIQIEVKVHGQKFQLDFSQDATFEQLPLACQSHTPNGDDYDWQKAKYLKKGSMLRSPRDDATTLLDLTGHTIQVIVSKLSETEKLQQASQRAAQRKSHKPVLPTVRPTQTRSSQDDTKYTFLQIRPLPHLPRPEKSLDYLKRLSQDPGIRSAMKKHKFIVGLLTEMNPIEHTSSTHEGTTRTLGLNRNAGEVIELRLRTDAYDGYRDYKVIRKTLCHELAHNVHGPHDRKFWDLCHLIEKEVDRGDWKHGGHSVGNKEYYEPMGGLGLEEAHDHGGWTGGSYTLGSGGGGTGTEAGLSRREVLARAADERMRRMEGGKGRPQSDGEGGNGEPS